MSDVIPILPLEQRQLERILRRVEHVQVVVRGCRLAARDLGGADRLAVERRLRDISAPTTPDDA